MPIHVASLPLPDESFTVEPLSPSNVYWAMGAIAAGAALAPVGASSAVAATASTAAAEIVARRRPERVMFISRSLSWLRTQAPSWAIRPAYRCCQPVFVSAEMMTS